jgi:hypothetical protein
MVGNLRLASEKNLNSIFQHGIIEIALNIGAGIFNKGARPKVIDSGP